MNWRKGVLIIGLLFTLGGVALVHQASARGWGGGPGGGSGCPWAGQPCYQMDEADREKLETFRNETVELRRQIAMKRAEKMALFHHQNPDPNAVARVAGELFDLRIQMQSKASDAGLPMIRGFQVMKGNGFHGMRGNGMGRQGQQLVDCPYRTEVWN